MAASGHSNAGRESHLNCDSLFAELASLIPDLKRNETQGSCGIFQTGGTRFAYVYHYKTRPYVEIWCRGDREQLLANDPGLSMAGRERSKPGWEESFPARFRVSSAKQAALAAAFLAEFSFPASTP